MIDKDFIRQAIEQLCEKHQEDKFEVDISDSFILIKSKISNYVLADIYRFNKLFDFNLVVISIHTVEDFNMDTYYEHQEIFHGTEQ